MSFNNNSHNPSDHHHDSYSQTSQLNIPKIRHQTSNAAPATPRMLRNTSNPSNLSDEYTINPDYIPVAPRTPSKRLSSAMHQRQSSTHTQNSMSSEPQGVRAGPGGLLPGVDFNPTSSPQRQQFHRKAIGDWEFTKTIGAGSMGKVKLARHRITHEICAIKVVTRAAKVWQRQHLNDPPTSDPHELAQRKKEYEKEVARDKRTIREAALGKILYHPFICRLYEMYAMSNHYYMLFEYVSGGQMLDYIVAHGSLKESQARKFCRGIASALDYCHSNNIVHRDLKIENIMINNAGEIKIIDFGLSNMYSHDHLLKTYCGSLYFAAPELLSAHPYRGPEVDIWSFGVVLFVLVCGRVPFDDKSVSNLHEKIKKGHIDYPDHLSIECVDLLKKMLVVDVSRRASIHEVISHKWMVKGYNGIASNYIPFRAPIQLPLNQEIIQEIVNLNLGISEEQVTMDLTEILSSSYYTKCVTNWVLKNSSDKFDPTLMDPTKGFHPLISIYHLVHEMLDRKKFKSNNPNKPSVTHHQPPQHSQQQQQQPSISTQAPNAAYTLPFPQAAHTSPHTEPSLEPISIVQQQFTPPPQQQQSPLEDNNVNSILRKLSTKKQKPEELQKERSKDDVRRIGSVKVTSKEKQQSQVPPLSNTSRRRTAQHQRATSAYTATIFNGDNAQPVRQEPVNSMRKYHPSARANSVGHTRKHSLNINKSSTYTVDQNAPPLPQFSQNGTDYDGFFDDEMDSITFSDESVKPKKKLTEKQIIEEYEKAPANSMPSIEFPKTLFLKGFFSVQTTSTKPLPIIRYDIITVLPQLGVHFVEVKGGFICVHYPSIVDTPKKRISSTLSSPLKSPTRSGQRSSNIDDNIDENYIDTVDGLKTPTLSETSSQTSRSKVNDINNTPDMSEKGTNYTSVLATPKNAHRRKFSLGNGLLGSKKGEKLTVSTTNVLPATEYNIPTTPAAANMTARSIDQSSESLTLDDTNGASDMLVSSRVEQQNIGSRSPSMNAGYGNDIDLKAKEKSSKTPLKFEIHIVKVPLVGLYGIQFKKVSGNTWLYKSLASEILNRLNL
ncbi:hypothetical protein PICMEDRAFT_57509 [Pichia membranifaciens NRRL Y-2026]|uniref:non-specific serine/threonine protein kinase n=1 Tax=Pichia membranifaciens NRRL Y-2026 TaxID=763406 RepID=A0A1E3NVB3_9ASCO|nr:hypothetical protein PICMEDRAFT_57509 [Pichia membranifaciens NRRL Y-2026]ODQ49483.1 hypothetical protein PICMEDRAFT_57509 [Pichia membranifaciens NRRL Y-2026]